MKQILFAFSALLFCFPLFPQVNRGVATRTAHETVFQQKIDKEYMTIVGGAMPKNLLVENNLEKVYNKKF